MKLNKYLEQQSLEICQMNGCTEEEHRCESYAYINDDMQVLDICSSDYFPGSGRPYAAIPLPWSGTMTELRREVGEQTEEWEMG